MDCAVHGILQARMLKWLAFPFTRGSSQPTNEPRSPTLQADCLLTELSRKPKNTRVGGLSLLQGIFPTQELNPGLQHCRQVLYRLSYVGIQQWQLPKYHAFHINVLHGQRIKTLYLINLHLFICLSTYTCKGLGGNTTVCEKQ